MNYTWQCIMMMVTQLGMTVFEIDLDGTKRYFVGQINVPSAEDMFISASGVEISYLISGNAIQKTAETLKLELTQLVATSPMLQMKLSRSAAWIVYSK